MNYEPKLFITPLSFETATYETIKGVRKKVYSSPIMFYGSFATWGGTERTENDLLVVENTAVIETWYRPDITSECRITNLWSGTKYEIIADPENIEMRNQYLRFKIRAIKGGV
jgi:hypothetical protein